MSEESKVSTHTILGAIFGTLGIVCAVGTIAVIWQRVKKRNEGDERAASDDLDCGNLFGRLPARRRRYPPTTRNPTNSAATMYTPVETETIDWSVLAMDECESSSPEMWSSNFNATSN